MSTLQISLAVGGGLVLVGVVAHSAWSARKNLPKQATPKPVAEPEPMPLQAPDDGFQLSELDGPPERQEPSFDADSGLAALTQLTQLTAPEKKPVLDILIDVIAPIALESPVSGEAALAAMPATRRVGSKPFAIEGLREASREWEIPAAGQRYSAFQCGVQLANRTGALNADRILRICHEDAGFCRCHRRRGRSFRKCWTKWPAPANSTSSPARTTPS